MPNLWPCQYVSVLEVQEYLGWPTLITQKQQRN